MTATKNPQICIFDNEKQHFSTLCTCISHLLTFWRRFVLFTMWNDLFCSCVDDVSIWSQMFNFVFLCPKRWSQFNSRIVRTQFSSVMILNNWKIIAETQSYIFRWRSCFRRRRVCLRSLVFCRGRRGMFFFSAGHTCNTLIFHQSTNQILNRPSSIYQYPGLYGWLMIRDFLQRKVNKVSKKRN